MKVPSPFYYQFVDLSAGHFFEYQLKPECLVVRVYDASMRCLKKQVLQQSDFAPLPITLPKGKNCEELFAWIIQQGWVPSLSAPGGFKAPQKSELPQTLPMPNPADLGFWKSQEASFLRVKTLKQHTALISALCEVSPEIFVSGDEKGMISVSDPSEDFRHLTTFKAHENKVHAICAVTSTSFATGSTKEIRIWEARESDVELVQAIEVRHDYVSALLRLKCGLLLSGSSNGIIIIWNSDFSSYKELNEHKEAIELLYEHSSGLIISASMDATIKVWNRGSDFGCILTIRGHEESVLALGERADGALFGCLADGRKMIWDLKTGKCLEETKGFKPYYQPVKTLSCGLVTVGDNHNVSLWHQRPLKNGSSANLEEEKGFALSLIEHHPGYVDLVDFAATQHLTRQQRLYLYLKVAQYFMQINDTQAAEDCFKKAFKDFPDAPFVFFKSFILHSRNKKEALYQLCVAMMTSYEKAGMTKDLMAACRLLLSVKKETSTFDRLYNCYRQALKPKKALEVGLAKIDFLLVENGLDGAERMCSELLVIFPEDRSLLERQAMVAERIELRNRLASFAFSFEENTEEVEVAPPIPGAERTGENGAKGLREMQSAIVFQQYDLLREHLYKTTNGPSYEKLPLAAQHSLLANFEIDALHEELQRNQAELETALATPLQIKPEIHCIATLSDIKTTIQAICEFAPHFFATAGVDGQMYIWANNEGYQLIGKINAPSNPINALCSPTQDLLVSGSGDGLIRILTMSPESPGVKLLKGHTKAVYDLLTLDEFSFASASADQTIRIWNTQSAECLHVLKGHEGPIHTLRKLATGVVVSGSADKTVRFWNPENNFACSHVYTGCSNIYALAIFSDNRLAIGYANGTIEIIETQTYTKIKTLEGHAGGMHSLCVTSTGYLISASGDYTVRLWDLDLDEPLVQTLGDHKNAVVFLYQMENGDLMSCSKDETIKVWSDDPQ